MIKFFVAYPSKPASITDTIETTINNLEGDDKIEITSWRNLDITGRFLIDGIQNKIDDVDCLVCDITNLNFNVLFEIGYAISKQKRVLPILNKTIWSEEKQLDNFGVFDTLGYFEYENSDDLTSFILDIENIDPLEFPQEEIEKKSPIYVLRPLFKSDATVRLISRIKKTRIGYRSFDPSEQSRLSLVDVYRNINRSLAIIVQLLADFATDYKSNNFRGAFIAGISYGLKKELLILQEGDSPIPLDYRDFVSVFKHPEDIDKYISDLAPTITEWLQLPVKFDDDKDKDFLSSLNLGATSAENEIFELSNYYLETDVFYKVLDGNARLAVGRKGTGKTALFYQVRRILQKDPNLLIVDLKPEGHQLKRFKNQVLKLVQEPIQEHFATAFWEYVLLLEICYKILSIDKKRHIYDHTIYKSYKNLEKKYGDEKVFLEGDFSERILTIVNEIGKNYSNYFDNQSINYLKQEQVTNLIYQQNIPDLTNDISEYLKFKSGIVILFDNIDKGWPTHGIEKEDILILRGLLDSTRKLGRIFSKNEIECNVTVFIRNDVYDLLVDYSPDRGKESKVSLDWTDRELLKQFILRRLQHNGLNGDLTFEQAWRTIFVSHFEGEDSAEYLIERSLMRPRNFLNFVNQCKSIAINLKHRKITKEDIATAEKVYSTDITQEIGYEIRDVFPQAEDLLYYFIGQNFRLKLKQIYKVFNEVSVEEDDYMKLLEILLWYGFLGIAEIGKSEYKYTFIFDVFYDMKKLKTLGGNLTNQDTLFAIHPTFKPFLK